MGTWRGRVLFGSPKRTPASRKGEGGPRRDGSGTAGPEGRRSGSVCGEGAAILSKRRDRVGTEGEAGGMVLIGIDVWRKILVSCRTGMASVVPVAGFYVICGRLPGTLSGGGEGLCRFFAKTIWPLPAGDTNIYKNDM